MTCTYTNTRRVSLDHREGRRQRRRRHRDRRRLRDHDRRRRARLRGRRSRPRPTPSPTPPRPSLVAPGTYTLAELEVAGYDPDRLDLHQRRRRRVRRGLGHPRGRRPDGHLLDHQRRPAGRARHREGRRQRRRRHRDRRRLRDHDRRRRARLRGRGRGPDRHLHLHRRDPRSSRPARTPSPSSRSRATTPSAWTCTNGDGGAFDAGTVTLEAGDPTVTCSITNDDQPVALVIEKVVVNDDGGTATVDDFGITTDAGALAFGAAVEAPTDTFTYTAATLARRARHVHPRRARGRGLRPRPPGPAPTATAARSTRARSPSRPATRRSPARSPTTTSRSRSSSRRSSSTTTAAPRPSTTSGSPPTPARSSSAPRSRPRPTPSPTPPRPSLVAPGTYTLAELEVAGYDPVRLDLHQRRRRRVRRGLGHPRGRRPDGHLLDHQRRPAGRARSSRRSSSTTTAAPRPSTTSGSRPTPARSSSAPPSRPRPTPSPTPPRPCSSRPARTPSPSSRSRATPRPPGPAPTATAARSTRARSPSRPATRRSPARSPTTTWRVLSCRRSGGPGDAGDRRRERGTRVIAVRRSAHPVAGARDRCLRGDASPHSWQGVVPTPTHRGCSRPGPRGCSPGPGACLRPGSAHVQRSGRGSPGTKNRASRCHTAGGTDVTRGSCIRERGTDPFVRGARPQDLRTPSLQRGCNAGVRVNPLSSAVGGPTMSTAPRDRPSFR